MIGIGGKSYSKGTVESGRRSVIIADAHAGNF